MMDFQTVEHASRMVCDDSVASIEIDRISSIRGGNVRIVAVNGKVVNLYIVCLDEKHIT